MKYFRVLAKLLIILVVATCSGKPPLEKPRGIEPTGGWVNHGITILEDPPIGVYLKSDMDRFMFEPIALDAIRFWNESVGCQMLYYSLDPKAKITVMRAKEPPNEMWVASAHYYVRNDVWAVQIKIYRVLHSHDRRVKNFAHELGHALGLDHASDHNNIMYETSRWGRYISPKTARALENMYCPWGERARDAQL